MKSISYVFLKLVLILVSTSASAQVEITRHVNDKPYRARVQGEYLDAINFEFIEAAEKRVEFQPRIENGNIKFDLNFCKKDGSLFENRKFTRCAGRTSECINYIRVVFKANNNHGLNLVNYPACTIF